MFDAIQALIGEIPVGYEGVIYVLSVPFVMWLVGQVIGIISSLFVGWRNVS